MIMFYQISLILIPKTAERKLTRPTKSVVEIDTLVKVLIYVQIDLERFRDRKRYRDKQVDR